MRNTHKQLLKLTYAALCFALCMVLPLLTAGDTMLGNYLCLMHLPVLLCGMLCGGGWGLVVGFSAPLIRSLLFGRPPIIPVGVGMMAELAIYGLCCGLLFRALTARMVLPGRHTGALTARIYLSLLPAMLLGRLAGGATKIALVAAGRIPTYTWHAFFAAYFVQTVPGVLLQLVLIPLITVALCRARLLPR